MRGTAACSLIVADETTGTAFAVGRVPLFRTTGGGGTTSRPVAAVVTAVVAPGSLTVRTTFVAPGTGTRRALRRRCLGRRRLTTGRRFGGIFRSVGAIVAPFAARTFGSGVRSAMTALRAARAISG